MAGHHELEYRTLQERRMALHTQMNAWDQICLPLSMAIFSGFSSAVWYIFDFDNCLAAVGSGAGIAFLLLVFWRRNVHIADAAIVELYPRILELEKELGLEFNLRYVFCHLRRGVKEKVFTGQSTQPPNSVDLPCTMGNWIADFWEWLVWVWKIAALRKLKADCTQDYEKLIATTDGKKEELIHIIRRGGTKVLDSRGHFEKDLVAIFPVTVVVFLVFSG